MLRLKHKFYHLISPCNISSCSAPPKNKPVRPKKQPCCHRPGGEKISPGRPGFLFFDKFFSCSAQCFSMFRDPYYNIWHYMYTIKDKQGKLLSSLIFSLAKLDNMNMHEWIIGHKKFAISSSIIAQVYVQIIYNQENASLFQMLSEKNEKTCVHPNSNRVPPTTDTYALPIRLRLWYHG